MLNDMHINNSPRLSHFPIVATIISTTAIGKRASKKGLMALLCRGACTLARVVSLQLARKLSLQLAHKPF